MRILESTNVDLISPFPVNEVHRAIGWMHCYKTLVASDDGPQTPEDWDSYLRTFFTAINVESYGIIDKNNKLNSKHEAPLVGFAAFERANLRNGYIHCATTRKAWGSGMVEEAGKVIITDVFEKFPDLIRISSFVINNNFPARGLAKRLGFKFEGTLEDSIVQSGEPRPASHFGLTKKNWIALCQSQRLSLSSQAALEPQQAPSEDQVNKVRL